jgi:hypothetical protein
MNDPKKLSTQALLQLCLDSHVKAGSSQSLRCFQPDFPFSQYRHQKAYPDALSNRFKGSSSVDPGHTNVAVFTKILGGQSNFLIGSRLIQSSVLEPRIDRLWLH